MEQCASCELEHDVNEDDARAAAHSAQLHFPFVRWCPENEPEMPGIFHELYPTPWLEEPRTVWFHDEECEQAYLYTGDFQYRECDSCGREICQQNPANGWMWQFREHETLGDVCLRCYEKEILDNGQPRSDFEGDSIHGGMFFSGFNPEPKAKGFEEVDDFRNYFVNGRATVRRYNAKALELLDSGHKVLTAYELMAIGNIEGYLTMLSRG